MNEFRVAILFTGRCWNEECAGSRFCFRIVVRRRVFARPLLDLPWLTHPEDSVLKACAWWQKHRQGESHCPICGKAMCLGFDAVPALHFEEV